MGLFLQEKARSIVRYNGIVFKGLYWLGTLDRKTEVEYKLELYTL